MVEHFDNAVTYYTVEKQDSLGDADTAQIIYLTLCTLLGHITGVVIHFMIGKSLCS